MINKQEIDFLKQIDKYNDGYTNYFSNSINLSFKDSINIKIEIKIDDMHDYNDEFEDFFYTEIILDEIYTNKLFINSITINQIYLEVPMQMNKYSIFLQLARLYNRYFQKPPLITNYSTEHSGFVYAIKLEKNDFLNFDFFHAIYQMDLKFDNLNCYLDRYYKMINFRFPSIEKKLSIRVNEIKNISTQTKVRRLGYIKMILNMFHNSAYYPFNIFNKKIEAKAIEYSKDILTYGNTKGTIEVSKTGNSAKPYIEAALSLRLLYSQNNMYKLSKYGKIFNILEEKLNKKTNNYFELTSFQKSFFLFSILQNDNLYLWILMDLVYIQNNETTFKKLKEEFQTYTISQLELTVKNSKLPYKDKNKIVLQIKRIKDWKKPKVYLEHIIEPRINWLLDLGFIDSGKFAENKIALSKKGLVLFHGLSSYFDIFMEKCSIIEQLECMDFFNLINELYNIRAVKIEKKDFILVDNYIEDSFKLFKTMAPNRVTASQAILYTCFMMLFKDKIVVNFCTIQEYLQSKQNVKFIFDWYKTEQDGSIRKKNDL